LHEAFDYRFGYFCCGGIWNWLTPLLSGPEILVPITVLFFAIVTGYLPTVPVPYVYRYHFYINVCTGYGTIIVKMVHLILDRDFKW